MELYQLNSFITIANIKNLTRASKLLNISQSALSNQIKLLEEELALPLFIRSTKGMELTESGRILLSHAQEILKAADNMKHKAFQLNGVPTGTITIGLNTEPNFLRVSALNKLLSCHFPDINVIFMASHSATTCQMLKQGTLDMGFFYNHGMSDEIDIAQIAEVPVNIVVPKSIHHDANNLNWKDIAELPWIWTSSNCPFFRYLSHEFDQRNLAPKMAVQSEDEYVIHELLLDGQGVAVIREDSAKKLEQKGEITIWDKHAFTVPLYLGWLKRRENDSALKATGHIIRGMWKKDLTVTNQF